MDNWTDWPSDEALRREDPAPLRWWLRLSGRYLGLSAALWFCLAEAGLGGVELGRAAAATAAGMLAFWVFVHLAPRKRIAVSLALLTLVLAAALTVVAWGVPGGGIILICGIASATVQRMPLVIAVPVSALATALFLAVVPHPVSWLGYTGLIFGIGVFGYVRRLDWEARASAAESAALAERARIAREIHDVLAHSLSAQLVHLEAARLMLDAGADREQLRERIVAARRMAQEGLAETRQALSALRGDFLPVDAYLKELVEQSPGATLDVRGLPRPLAAEAGLAVRRTAQEALTNARKHAPGASCALRWSYLDGAVELEVRNGPGEGGPTTGLATTGSGLGLLGMRERAELLGGTLAAGPEAEGFRVLLTLPAA